MSRTVKCLAVSLFLLFAGSDALCQIDAASIASHCAADSGNPRSGYVEYGEKLARTLGLLTPQQLARVFGRNTTVIVPQTLNEQLGLDSINYDFASSDLTPDSLMELDKVVEYLTFNNQAKISIGGHAQYQYGGAQVLSEQRANAARDYLISQGVPEDRIEAIGYGGSEQIIPGGRDDGTEANRRIEITVNE